jgi:hypothetical protein
MSSSKINIVGTVHESYPQGSNANAPGMLTAVDTDGRFVPAQEFTLETGAAMGTTDGDPPYLVMTSLGPAINWRATSDTDAVAVSQIVLPADFDPRADRLMLGLLAQKFINNTDPNATLALTVAMQVTSPGDSYASGVATFSVNPVVGLGGRTTTDVYRWFVLDIAASIRAANSTALSGLRPGSIIRLTIGPSAAVGAGMRVRLAGVGFRYGSCLAHANRLFRMARSVSAWVGNLFAG